MYTRAYTLTYMHTDELRHLPHTSVPANRSLNAHQWRRLLPIKSAPNNSCHSQHMLRHAERTCAACPTLAGVRGAAVTARSTCKAGVHSSGAEGNATAVPPVSHTVSLASRCVPVYRSISSNFAAEIHCPTVSRYPCVSSCNQLYLAVSRCILPYLTASKTG